MTSPFITAFFLLTAIITHAAEISPARPTPAQVAQILDIAESRVSTVRKDLHPKLEGKVLWLATYKISGEQDCSFTITLYPGDRIKTDIIEKIGANQRDFQKITRDDGDVIYHALGDRGDQGTFYMTTLINHENDWDMILMLSRESGIDESKLPFVIAKDGIKLVHEIESILRKQKAEQDASPDP